MTAWVTTSACITSAADESEKALEAALFSRRTVASTQQWALAAILCRGQCLWEYAREVVCRFLLSHLYRYIRQAEAGIFAVWTLLLNHQCSFAGQQGCWSCSVLGIGSPFLSCIVWGHSWQLRSRCWLYLELFLWEKTVGVWCLLICFCLISFFKGNVCTAWACSTGTSAGGFGWCLLRPLGGRFAGCALFPSREDKESYISRF